jgi:hypothetical protein
MRTVHGVVVSYIDSISRLEDVINIVWMYDGMERTLLSESLYEEPLSCMAHAGLYTA